MADPVKSRACERSGKRSGAGTKSGDRGSGTVSGHSRKRLSASGAWSGGPRSGSRAESGCHKTLERTLSDKSAAHAALRCSGLKSYNPFACVVTRPIYTMLAFYRSQKFRGADGRPQFNGRWRCSTVFERAVSLDEVLNWPNLYGRSR